VLFLLSVSASHGSEIVISETMWNGLKLEYATLKDSHRLLSESLTEAEEKSRSLNANLASLWLQLNDSKMTVLSLEARLKTAQTQAALLQDQLIESENGLSQLNAQIRKEKIKSYLIGGGIGAGIVLLIFGILAIGG
jgi:septal ring factor EnvC (AmiA/AmiB activator)